MRWGGAKRTLAGGSIHTSAASVARISAAWFVPACRCVHADYLLRASISRIRELRCIQLHFVTGRWLHCGSHDPDQRRGSAAVQGVRAVRCLTRFLRWTLLDWVAAASGIAANSQYAKARFTAVVEDHMSDVSKSVQKAIAHNVCSAPPIKLFKADWKPYALIKKMPQNEQKLARENAETNGWDVAQETTAVTEQFCAAVKGR